MGCKCRQNRRNSRVNLRKSYVWKTYTKSIAVNKVVVASIRVNHFQINVLVTLLQSENWIVGYLTSCDKYTNTLHWFTRLIFNTNKIWETFSPCGHGPARTLRHTLVDIGSTLLCISGYNGLPSRTLPINLIHETTWWSERVDNAALSSAVSYEIPGQVMETALFWTFSR